MKLLTHSMCAYYLRLRAHTNCHYLLVRSQLVVVAVVVCWVLLIFHTEVFLAKHSLARDVRRASDRVNKVVWPLQPVISASIEIVRPFDLGSWSLGFRDFRCAKYPPL